MKEILLFNILFLSIFVQAADYMPYQEAKITVEQFESYYQEIKTNFANTEKIYKEHNLVTYADDKTRMSFAFTLKGHPAHPSWITRQVIFVQDNLDMQQIGYFAGEEKEFAILFQQYAQLTEQTRRQFQR